MPRIFKSLLFMLFIGWAGSSLAAFVIYHFDDPEKEKHFRALTHELRCPKCQNQTIADSDAPLALDLKNIAYDMVRAGATDDEVRKFMRDRYGDFILYRPPLEPKNYLLWYGPLAVLLISGLAIGVMVLRPKKTAPKKMAKEEHERVEKLMHEMEEQ